ncbi:unnamed protein product, partial [Prorocentrum cordatum]
AKFFLAEAARLAHPAPDVSQRATLVEMAMKVQKEFGGASTLASVIKELRWLNKSQNAAKHVWDEEEDDEMLETDGGILKEMNPEVGTQAGKDTASIEKQIGRYTTDINTASTAANLAHDSREVESKQKELLDKHFVGAGFAEKIPTDIQTAPKAASIIEKDLNTAATAVNLAHGSQEFEGQQKELEGKQNKLLDQHRVGAGFAEKIPTVIQTATKAAVIIETDLTTAATAVNLAYGSQEFESKQKELRTTCNAAFKPATLQEEKVLDKHHSAVGPIKKIETDFKAASTAASIPDDSHEIDGKQKELDIQEEKLQGQHILAIGLAQKPETDIMKSAIMKCSEALALDPDHFDTSFKPPSDIYDGCEQQAMKDTANLENPRFNTG